MFEEKHIPNKLPDERLITFVRPHWVYLIGSILLFLAMVALPVVVYFIFQFAFPALLQVQLLYVICVLVSSVYYLMTIMVLYNSFIDHQLDLWVVTNYRIIAIVQNNLFNRTISELKLDVIQDVTANQKGFLQSMFNFGDVVIQTSGEKNEFHFNDIPQPFQVAENINKLIQGLKK